MIHSTDGAFIRLPLAVLVAASILAAGCAQKPPAVESCGCGPDAAAASEPSDTSAPGDESDPDGAAASGDIPDSVTPDELAAEMERNPDVFVLDVRNQDDYEYGHIAGAVVIPIDKLKDNLETNRVYPEVNHGRTPSKDQRIVTVCTSGARSRSIVPAMREWGYVRTSNLAGGMVAWSKAGLPIERGLEEQD